MNDGDAVEEFREYWEQSERYVLLRAGTGRDDLVIFEPVSSLATIICEDDELSALVIQRMLAAGVRVVDPQDLDV